MALIFQQGIIPYPLLHSPSQFKADGGSGTIIWPQRKLIKLVGASTTSQTSNRYASFKTGLTLPSATGGDIASTESATGETALPETNNLEVKSKENSSLPKKLPMTAREKLRAARVLSRYTDPKKPVRSLGLGSKVLDALRESDGGNKRRSGLPQAPENLLDDSKRGMPKQGLTFDFPGGSDLFFILLSFVLISTVMFTTTYVVWKVGAIHFNEY